MTRIAHQYGFSDPLALYDHPENAELKARRTDPNVLAPGDRVFIPEYELKEVERPTGAQHRFVAKRPNRRLRLEVQRADGSPMGNVEYELKFGSVSARGRTSSDGRIEIAIPVDARNARLTLDGIAMGVAIGDLDPVREAPDSGIGGIQARLQNLGFGCSDRSGELDEATRAAIERFQKSSGLTVTGVPDEAFLAALEREHQS